MALRKKINAADKAYIEANLDKNSLEIQEEIGLEQMAAAEYIKTARAQAMLKRAKIGGEENGRAITFIDNMDDVVDKDKPRTGLNAPYIFRRKNADK